MPTTLTRVIYGMNKDVDFGKFNSGVLTKSIAYDLEEFGKKGVQGVKVSGDVDRLITYEKAAKRAKEPYIQAGTHNNDLVVVVRDKKESKFEAIAVAVKGYVPLRAELAKSNASVTNLDKGDTIIDGAASAQGDKYKTTSKDEHDTDFGEITGNIILCAHGRPASVPSGRIIGDQFGKKTPDEIVKLVTGDKDPKKRIGKDYNGVITLSGCFTASGGPEASKQDDPFAAKVLSLLRGKGYSKVSVVGMPGPSITARKDGDTDSSGTPMQRGDKHVQTNAPTVEKYLENEKLETEYKKAAKDYQDAVNAFNNLVPGYNQALEEKKNATPTTLSQAQAKFTKIEKQLSDARLKLNSTKNTYEQSVKKLKDSGLQDTIAQVKGTFGLRVINT